MFWDCVECIIGVLVRVFFILVFNDLDMFVEIVYVFDVINIFVGVGVYGYGFDVYDGD